MRYLCRVSDREVHAYANNRRDFFLKADDTLWAHESHSWLLSSPSGAKLAHRIGATYYDAETNAPLFFETAELPS
ncbi:MAG: hypothetical protein SGJ13_16540 [Actinomycetota bacterium]|nr:hypothetical protein [Actinomycetota bacterium]